ncbi:acyl-CoA dehydrogenase [Salinarimonas sp.]|uniref:acyl-CoA dehydrogenase family protein n=1 Tax=Salinarimonas sp. TaxID=2766526 RepID=UPI0032D98F91
MNASDHLDAAPLFDPAVLALPLLEERHRRLAESLQGWVRDSRDEVRRIAGLAPEAAARGFVALLARDGWLAAAIPAEPGAPWDLRAVCLCRHAFAWLEDLLDFSFSIQALSAFAIGLGGHAHAGAVRALREGRVIGAFALTEPSVGSDLARIATTARAEGDRFQIDGEKAWIAHAGVADLYCVLARTGVPGPLGLSLVVVDARAASGLATEPVALVAPRAIGHLRLSGCETPRAALVGEEGLGLMLAGETLDAFRLTVAAAASGFARRALQVALGHARERIVKAGPLARTQLGATRLARMACAGNGVTLVALQAAWEADSGQPSAAVRSCMAKVVGTEAAQTIVDDALQLCGAAGCALGSETERLYREIRALRIYEGTTEIQLLAIGDALADGVLT